MWYNHLMSCSLAQVSVKLSQKLVPLSDSVLSGVPSLHKTCLSRPRMVFQVLAWGTGCVCSTPVVASTVISTWLLPSWVWVSVIQTICQAFLYLNFSHRPPHQRGFSHLGCLIAARVWHSWITWSWYMYQQGTQHLWISGAAGLGGAVCPHWSSSRERSCSQCWHEHPQTLWLVGSRHWNSPSPPLTTCLYLLHGRTGIHEPSQHQGSIWKHPCDCSVSALPAAKEHPECCLAFRAWRWVTSSEDGDTQCSEKKVFANIEHLSLLNCLLFSSKDW